MRIQNFPARRGTFFALLAALLFGASTPLVQRIGTHTGGWMTAALLYAGAAIAGLSLRSAAVNEAPLRRRHWPRLLMTALFGAVVGPAALAWGLQHTSGMSASLMLTLEAVFTVLLSLVLYGEHVSGRVGLAIASITLGGAFLVFDRFESNDAQVLGLLAVIAAALAWGVDNTLSRALADLDSGRVIVGKSVVGAICSLLIALTTGQMAIALFPALGLLLIGAFGYGLSLRFYLLAQREFGAARTGSVFAAAPFIGAVIAFCLAEQEISFWLSGGAVMILAGVLLHVTERHEHAHVHDALTHEHAHTHDDGHHNHTHEPAPAGAHSHPHLHETLIHRHPHVPDAHHGHSH